MLYKVSQTTSLRHILGSPTGPSMPFGEPGEGPEADLLRLQPCDAPGGAEASSHPAGISRVHRTGDFTEHGANPAI